MKERVLELIRAGCSEAEFNDCALALYRYQRERNPAYANYCAHIGAPETLSDWREIPAVPQAAFKQFALRCFPEEATTKTFRTSGTTGEGFGSHHFETLELYEESILRAWDHFQLPRLPQIILTPSPEEAPHSSLSHMMGVLRRHTSSQRFWAENVEILKSVTEPVLVMGTALAFLHLFERGPALQLPPGSQALETGGYKGSRRTLTKPELYALFEERLGLGPEAILNEYSMTELSSQFYTRGLGNPHAGPPWVRHLLIDPESGQPVTEPGKIGMLRIFDLANVGSVQAIQTADLAIERPAAGVHGVHPVQFELLGRDPNALPRGCSRAADEMLSNR